MKTIKAICSQIIEGKFTVKNLIALAIIGLSVGASLYAQLHNYSYNS